MGIPYEAGPQVGLINHIPTCDLMMTPGYYGGACVCAALTGRYAQAYVNHGRWVADCPRVHCYSAEELEPKQTIFYCSNCHVVVEIAWPVTAQEITDALAARPVPQTRNWAPAGHRQAIETGFPDGQSPADLEAETRRYMAEELI